MVAVGFLAAPVEGNAMGRSAALLDRVVTLCERTLADPTTAIEVPEGERSFLVVNADGTEVTNSLYLEPEGDGSHSQGLRAHLVPGGALARCSVWHAYWDGDHPYDDLTDVIDAAAPGLAGGPVTRSGGQVPDMLIRAERWIWSDGQFPPRFMISATINSDSVNLYLDRAVADAP